MKTSALITMLFAWAVVTYYAGKFFWKVLRTPQKKGSLNENGK